MVDEEAVANAKRCVLLAKQAWLQGQKDKGVRLCEKSIRIHKTAEAEALLRAIQSGEPPKSSGDSRQSPSPSDAKPTRSPSSSTPDPPKRQFTPEQASEAKRINNCKTYYSILGVDRSASEQVLKKAYRKAALKMHPDKNGAPGASDAFKKIGSAYSVLSDKEKKRQYDLTDGDITKDAHQDYSRGSNVRRRHGHSTFRHGGQYYEFEEGPSAEDIFNMFFGGGFEHATSGRMHRTHGQRRHPQQHTQEHSSPLVSLFMQLAPLLILVFMSLLSNLLTPEPAFSLHYSNTYHTKRLSDNLKVPFYVQRNFDQRYSQKLDRNRWRSLQREIEQDYLEQLRSECYQEQLQKETLYRKGQYFRNQEWIKRAQDMPMPKCKRYEDLQPKRSRGG